MDSHEMIRGLVSWHATAGCAATIAAALLVGSTAGAEEPTSRARGSVPALYEFLPIGPDGWRDPRRKSVLVQTAAFNVPPYPAPDRFPRTAAGREHAAKEAPKGGASIGASALGDTSTGDASTGDLWSDRKPADQPLPSTQRTRFYLGALVGAQTLLDASFAPGLELSSTQLALSGLIGVNLGRYVGVEIAADFAEADLDAKGIGTIAEFSQSNLIPQLRLRYPFDDDRMTAYLTAGVGYGITEVNDATPAAQTPGAPRFTAKDRDTQLVYALGAGFEYFYEDNIVFTLDAKYTSQTAEVEIDRTSREVELDALRLLAGARLMFPGPSYRERGADGAGFGYDRRYARPYALFQVGPPSGAVALEEEIDGTFSFGGRQSLILGGGFGYDFSRYLGLELIANWHELGIQTFRADKNAESAVVEYGIWTLMPLVRLRYPVLEERLVPYMVAGVGLGYTETNDPADEIDSLDVPSVSADHYGIAAALGAGLEYMVAENMAVGAEVKYIYHRPEIELDNSSVEVNADSLLGTLGFRVYF